MSSHQQFKAVCYLVVAAFLFASTGVVIRFLSIDVGVESVVFYRNFIGLLLFLPLLYRRGFGFLRTEKILGHFFRAMAGLSAMYAFFYAIANFTLAAAMMFVYAAPIFVPVFAYVVLGEAISGRHWLIALIGLSGIVLVFRPAENLLAMIPIGLFCTFMSSLAFVVVRKLSFTEPAERVVFYFSLFGTLVAIVPFFILPAVGVTAMVTPDQLDAADYEFRHWSLLLLLGLFTTTAQWFLTRAYSYAPAGRIAPASYLTVVIAGCYGALLWGEIPTALTILGYIIVFMAVLLTLPRNVDRAAREKAASPV